MSILAKNSTIRRDANKNTGIVDANSLSANKNNFEQVGTDPGSE